MVVKLAGNGSYQLPETMTTLKNINVLVENQLLTAVLNRIEIKKKKIKVFIQEKGKYVDIGKITPGDKEYFNFAKKEYKKILDSQQKNKKKAYFSR